jgi:hypothetical protein
MGNETEKDLRNKQSNPAGTVDPSQKNPSHQGGQNPNQQDPSKKNLLAVTIRDNAIVRRAPSRLETAGHRNHPN